MPALIAIRAFFSDNRWLVYAIAAALIVAVLCTLAYCAGGAGETIKQQDGTIKIQTQTIAADGNAADARVADTVRIQNQQREIEDAVENTTSVDAARRARGCAILLQQNRRSAAVAAGC